MRSFVFALLTLFRDPAGLRRPRARLFSIPRMPAPIFSCKVNTSAQIGTKAKVGAQVIALGNGKFDAVLYTQGLPGAAGMESRKFASRGRRADGIAHFKGKNFQGTIKDGRFQRHGRKRRPLFA